MGAGMKLIIIFLRSVSARLVWRIFGELRQQNRKPVIQSKGFISRGALRACRCVAKLWSRRLPPLRLAAVNLLRSDANYWMRKVNFGGESLVYSPTHHGFHSGQSDH